jgi:glycosyltransferase involved in cell wall biosynthesis
VAPPVSACLIVRDEEAGIAECVAALAPYVAEIVVADTGSRDATAALARAAGARLLEVPWTDDFAAARNAAMAACRHDWVLSVDADERASGDATALGELLAGADPGVAALSVEIREVDAPDPRGTATHRAVKMLRRSACCWRGRVHEEVVARAGGELVAARLPARALTLVHSGYADPAVFAAKVARNLRLARLEVAGLPANAPPERRIGALLDLGRTLLAAGDRGEAAETLAAVRRLAGAGAPAWIWATDFLAWDALRHDEVELAWELAAELAEQGAGERHVRPLTEHLLAR